MYELKWVEVQFIVLFIDYQEDQVSQKEKEEELCKRTLLALNEMRIKFPGKTDEEADYLLDKVPDFTH